MALFSFRQFFLFFHRPVKICTTMLRCRRGARLTSFSSPRGAGREARPAAERYRKAHFQIRVALQK